MFICPNLSAPVLRSPLYIVHRTSYIGRPLPFQQSYQRSVHLVIEIQQPFVLFLIERFKIVREIHEIGRVLVSAHEGDPVLVLPASLVADLNIPRQLFMFHFLHRYRQSH